MISIDGVINTTVSNRVTSAEQTLNRLNSGDDRFQTELKNVMDKYNPSKMDNTHKRLWDACVEAESLFVGKMIKEMKKTVPKNEWLHGGHAEDIFEDMLYDEYSLNMSKNYNFGMARLLYDEMSRKL
jgi:Rod binding domain-containing protein